MAPSFDYAGSSLLCTEEESSIFEDDIDGGADNSSMVLVGHRYHRFCCGEQGLDCGEGVIGLFPMMMQSEDSLGLLLERELEHLPCGDYLNRLRCGHLHLLDRKQAVDWIWKVQSYYSFGPLCACLSINYLDRFLSAYKLPDGKAWMMQLVATACLSLAAKMEETDAPFTVDVQIDESTYIFEAKTIQRMELLVLSTLKWRMLSVTPFSFIDHFLWKLNGDKMPCTSSILQSVHIIMSIIKGIDFLEFRPSEIAAAVAIYVTRENHTADTEAAISRLSGHVEKGRLLMCLELIHDSSLVNGLIKFPTSSSQSVPPSPIGVLDAACHSYKSNVTPAESCAHSIHNSPASAKRRKLNKPYVEAL
ncbi:hypothetical protein Dimus_025014 [Dionaea muscipula]